MVTSGHSTYFETIGGYFKNDIIPLPYIDSNSFNWGSTSDVDDGIHKATGWVNFVFHSYSAPYLWNYPSDSGGFHVPKRAVCGKEV